MKVFTAGLSVFTWMFCDVPLATPIEMCVERPVKNAVASLQTLLYGVMYSSSGRLTTSAVRRSFSASSVCGCCER